jgi:hypothetical protein
VRYNHIYAHVIPSVRLNNQSAGEGAVCSCTERTTFDGNGTSNATQSVSCGIGKVGGNEAE